jgi:zinc transport system substrate-binding protein
MRYLILIVLAFNLLISKNIVAVSIPPQKYILEELAKDLVKPLVVVKPGNSPHTYEPKASEMVALSKAKLYLAIGVEFENVWLKRFKEQNRDLKIVHTDSNITKISMSNKKSSKKDPHIWLNINNLKIIAKNTANALISIDNKNREFYTNNLKKFLEKLNTTDKEIKDILKDLKVNKFLIFHPSWGYFAKEYNLEQIPIEIEGKEPSPKELVNVLKLAKKYNIKAIFTQPEFSQKQANLIAKELNIKVIKVTPLKENVLNNMLEFAKALKGE